MLVSTDTDTQTLPPCIFERCRFSIEKPTKPERSKVTTHREEKPHANKDGMLVTIKPNSPKELYIRHMFFPF
jgi:hypothetical protein